MTGENKMKCKKCGSKNIYFRYDDKANRNKTTCKDCGYYCRETLRGELIYESFRNKQTI